MASESSSLLAGASGGGSSGQAAVDISRDSNATGNPFDIKEIPASGSGAAPGAAAADGGLVIREIDVKDLPAGGGAGGSGGAAGGAPRTQTELPFPKPGKAAYFWMFFKYSIVSLIPTYSCYVLAHTSSRVLSVTVHADTTAKDFDTDMLWYTFITLFPIIVLVTLTQLILDALAKQFLFYRLLEFGYLVRYEKSSTGTWSSLFFYFLCVSCGLFGYYFFLTVPDHTDELGAIVVCQFAALLLFYTFIVNSTAQFVSVHDFFAAGDGSKAIRFVSQLERLEESELRAACSGKLEYFASLLRTKAACCGDNRDLSERNGGLQSFASFAGSLRAAGGAAGARAAAAKQGCWDEFWSNSELWALKFVLGSKYFMADWEDLKISRLFTACSACGALFPLLLQIVVTVLKLFLGDDWVAGNDT